MAIYKYLKTDEGEKLVENLKVKGTELKEDFENVIDIYTEYLEEFKTLIYS
ncbi:MAG: hypothetical protein ACI8UX_001625 [Psychromonas sp.]